MEGTGLSVNKGHNAIISTKRIYVVKLIIFWPTIT